MKEQDDELKDLFRRKNLEDAFVPDEANWEKMAEVLKNEKTGGKKRFLFIGILLLVTVGLGTWLLIVPAEDSKTQAIASTEANGKSSATNGSTSSAQPASVQKAQAKQKQLTDAKQVTTHQRSSANIVEQTSAPLLTIAQQIEKNSAAMEVSIQKRKKKNNTNELVGEKSPINRSAAADNKQGVTPVADATSVSSKNSAAINSESLAEKIKNTLVTGNASSDTKDDASAENHEQNLAESSPARILTPTAVSLTTEIVKETVAIISQASVAVSSKAPDSTLVETTVPIDSISVKPLTKQRLLLDVGTNYLAGWPANTTKEGMGLSPLAGFTYYYEPDKKLGFSVGLHYTSISNLGATSHTSVTTRLKLGAERDITVISAVKMYYLLIPAKITYGFSDRDLFSAGCTIAYMVDAESKIETYNTRLDYGSVPVVSKGLGYTAGFNRYDAQITVAYRRWLYKAFYVNGEVYYGLVDVKKNALYTEGVFDRNYGFRLSLGINLWKK